MIAFKMLLFGFGRKISRAQARDLGVFTVSSALMEAQLKADLKIYHMPWAWPPWEAPHARPVWPPSCSVSCLRRDGELGSPELGSSVCSPSLGSSSSSCPSVVAMLDIRKGFGRA
ncbi:hypothetical protein Dimus_003743 [Dionaea muscipula]